MGDLVIDGQAMNVAAGAKSMRETITSVPDPSLTFEFNELKRKLERKEIELKRKDKEILGYQKELGRLNKDNKLASSEMQSLRERNEQLQQSLMNSRIQSQSTRDDADSRMVSSRIRELESALGTATHKFEMSEEELDASKKLVAVLEAKFHSLSNEFEILRMERNTAVGELDNAHKKTRAAEELQEAQEKHLRAVEAAKQALHDSILSLRGQLDAMTAEKESQAIQNSEFREEIKKLRIMLSTRGETNSELQKQIDEINKTKLFITKEEHEKFVAAEKENKSLLTRNKDLVKSLDHHMDLLRRSEEESAKVKKSYDEIKPLMVANAGKYEDMKKSVTTLTTSNKDLKKEVATLRKEKQDLQALLDQSRVNGAQSHEVQTMKNGLAALARSKQEEIEARLDEKKRRRQAEESAKALRNRVSFLLDQLDLASKISLSWQEQRELLQSEVASLQRANFILRSRLVSVQRNYMERYSGELFDPDLAERLVSNAASAGGGAFLTEMESPGRRKGPWRDPGPPATPLGVSNASMSAGAGTGMVATGTLLPQGNSSANLGGSGRRPSPLRLGDTGASSIVDDRDNNRSRGRSPDRVGTGTGGGGAAILAEVSVMDILSGRTPLGIDALGGPFATTAANTIPTTVESSVERMLFDVICGFTSGRRASSGKKKKRSQQPFSLYKVRIGDDGLAEIHVNTSGAANGGGGTSANVGSPEDVDVEAEELLNSLQMHAFLKFSQVRPDGKVSVLFTEKLASVLNFHRSQMLDMATQLAEARLELGKVVSKIAVAVSRTEKMRKSFVHERVAKQKSVMKYVREQLRGADIKVKVASTSSAALEQMEELREIAQRTLLAGAEGTRIKRTMDFVAQNMVELRTICSSGGGGGGGGRTGNGSAGPGGGLGVAAESVTMGGAAGADGSSPSESASSSGGMVELKLPDHQMDDETLHSVVGLVTGAIAEPRGDGEESGREDGFAGSGSGGGSGGDGVVGMTGTLGEVPQSLSRSFYIDRVVMINLQSNKLTDLSCKPLAVIVERSSSLRLLDLRENAISVTGVKILFDAMRRNETVVYVTQKQGGALIEGFREIVSTGQNAGMKDIQFAHFEMPKHPIRIDVRHNSPNEQVAQDAIDAMEARPHNTTQPSAAGATAGGAGASSRLKRNGHSSEKLSAFGSRFISPRRNNDGSNSARGAPGGDSEAQQQQTYNPGAYRDEARQYTIGTWTPQGIADGANRKPRPVSAGAGRSLRLGGGGHRPPAARPSSANATGSRSHGSGGNAVRVAAGLRDLRRNRPSGIGGNRSRHVDDSDMDGDGDIEDADEGDDDDDEVLFGPIPTGARSGYGGGVGGGQVVLTHAERGGTVNSILGFNAPVPLDDQIRALQTTMRRGGPKAGGGAGARNRGRGHTNQPVFGNIMGSMLDDEIRGIQENVRRDGVTGRGAAKHAAYQPSSQNPIAKFEEGMLKLSVKDRNMKFTRAVYNSKVDVVVNVEKPKLDPILSLKSTTIGTMEVMGDDDDSEKEAARRTSKLANGLNEYNSAYKSSGPTILLKDRIKLLSGASARQKANAAAVSAAAAATSGGGGGGGGGAILSSRNAKARKGSFAGLDGGGGYGGDSTLGQQQHQQLLTRHASTGGTGGTGGGAPRSRPSSGSGKRDQGQGQGQGGMSKAHSARALLEGLHKLNPATLF